MRPPSAERPAPPGRPPRIPETLYLNDSAAVAPWQPRDIRSLRSVASTIVNGVVLGGLVVFTTPVAVIMLAAHLLAGVAGARGVR
jgi:hypothetical protein